MLILLYVSIVILFFDTVLIMKNTELIFDKLFMKKHKRQIPLL